MIRALGYANAILTDTGSTNNYIVACPFGAPTVYNQGTEIYFIPANSNTDPSSVAYNINTVYQGTHIHFGGGVTDTANTALLYQGVATFDTNAAQNVLYLAASFY
jgi:hypothetical protein